MDKLLIIADVKNKCFAIPRGLSLASRLGFLAEVVAFTYAPLGKLKLNSEEERGVRQRLMAERKQAVQARVDKYSEAGQKVSLEVVWEKDILRLGQRALRGG